VGILDVSTRNYTTVMRSHVGHVLSASVDPQRRHIATVSDDRTIRIWDVDTLQQVLSTDSHFSFYITRPSLRLCKPAYSEPVPKPRYRECCDRKRICRKKYLGAWLGLKVG